MEGRGNEAANVTLQLTLAGALIIALFAVGAATVFLDIPDENDTAFNILLGNIMGWLSALVAFGFPSNIGNAKKDDTIKRLADAASAPLTTVETRTTAKEDTHDVSARGPEPAAPEGR